MPQAGRIGACLDRDPGRTDTDIKRPDGRALRFLFLQKTAFFVDIYSNWHYFPLYILQPKGLKQPKKCCMITNSIFIRKEDGI